MMKRVALCKNIHLVGFVMDCNTNHELHSVVQYSNILKYIQKRDTRRGIWIRIFIFPTDYMTEVYSKYIVGS